MAEDLAMAPAGEGHWVLFEDQTAAAGLDFVHSNGMSGEHHFPENLGGGAALFDFDRDGDQDLYLVQSGALASRPAQGPGIDLQGVAVATDRLYRNDSRPGQGIRFVDVTSTLGADTAGYGMGVTAGDYDNDGQIDLYVTNFGSNQLLRNLGGGAFEDTTLRSGTDDRRWSVAALFFDYDRDGWLDLYVGNYVDFRLSNHKPCVDDAGRPEYCGPTAYDPEPDRLFRNRGDGTFEDVSGPSGIASRPGPGLGAAAADFDGDGWLDLYVANDQAPNFLWHNEQGRRFTENALLAGCAVNRAGLPEASMGVAIDDVDGDGDEDLFLTHLARETHTLYLNQGGQFHDATLEMGLAAPTVDATGFGVAWLDVDLDGGLDLLTVNGAVRGIEEQVRRGAAYPYAQSPQVFWQRQGRFEEVPVARAGPAFEVREVGRGAAFGDLDDDGDLEVVIVANNGPARLLVNRAPARRWLGLSVTDGVRDQLGARVGIELDDGSWVWRRVHVDGSYASASDPRISIALAGRWVTGVEVRWPDGGRERFEPPDEGRYVRLRRGEGLGKGGS